MDTKILIPNLGAEILSTAVQEDHEVKINKKINKKDWSVYSQNAMFENLLVFIYTFVTLLYELHIFVFIWKDLQVRILNMQSPWSAHLCSNQGVSDIYIQTSCLGYFYTQWSKETLVEHDSSPCKIIVWSQSYELCYKNVYLSPLTLIPIKEYSHKGWTTKMVRGIPYRWNSSNKYSW